MTVPVLLLLGFVFFIGLYPDDANAVPSFVSKTGKSCTYCHNAWPQLNKKGRDFKELGYRLSTEDDETLAEILTEGRFPIGALLKARPYDKKESGDRLLRALHEVELFFAGRVGDNLSAYVELEAESETGFEIEVSPAVLSYHHNPALNVQFTWGPYLFADPYGFLGDSYRLTRSRAAVTDQRFGGADGTLRSTRQAVSLYGRPTEKLLYVAGVAGEAGGNEDPNGVEAENFFGRLAFDITDNFMVGVFGVRGENNTDINGNLGREFSRYGVDVQADLANTRVQAAYVNAEDDRSGVPGTDENSAASLQLMHVFTSGESRMPTWVPVARFDQYERNNGRDKYEELTLNLGYYFSPNAKGFIEYWEQLDVPTGITSDSRVTVQFAVGF